MNEKEFNKIFNEYLNNRGIKMIYFRSSTNPKHVPNLEDDEDIYYDIIGFYNSDMKLIGFYPIRDLTNNQKSIVNKLIKENNIFVVSERWLNEDLTQYNDFKELLFSRYFPYTTFELREITKKRR